MKKGNLRAISFAAIAVALTACGNQHSAPTVEAIQATQTDANFDFSAITDSHTSKIIGSNDLVKVKADVSNIDASLRKLVDAFGLMVDQGGLCTATHIGNGYVLTAGHCVLNESLPQPQTTQNQGCSTLKIYWGYRGSPETGSAKPQINLVSQCTQIIYAELSSGKDFAILKVDQAPKAKIAISTESKRTSVNTKLTLFGYPQGRPLEWSQYCPLKNSLISGRGASTFLHQCDTEGGNSGSTILAINSSGAAKVIGIHNGALGFGMDYNYATYLYDVRVTLKQKNLDLESMTSNGLSF